MLELIHFQSCMTEDQKYQGALYKNKKAKTTNNEVSPPVAAPKTMPQPASVTDVADEYDWRNYEVDSNDDGSSPADPPPEAPTPPPADGGAVNVFDFLVANPTPTASNVSLPQPAHLNKETQLVRFDQTDDYLDPLGQMVEDAAMVQYGSGPVPASSFETPAPKGERKKSRDGEKDVKKDKKRKRLHVDVHDHVMTDAPPVLHSGLTGGLNKLMTRPSVFPPSPDSGGDLAETPTSPLKKTRHSKHSKPSRAETIGNSLIAMISSGPKTKTKKRKHSSSTTKKSDRHRIEGPKDQKLLEYRPGSKEGKDGDNSAMILYKPRAEHFLSFVNKGPESERGCSMNKALKRYHRERSASGNNAVSKLTEEKELWRSLRLKKNDRGEIVLFCI